MKTTKQNVAIISTETWLPVFKGFYGNIWETLTDIDNELDYYNDPENRDPKLPSLTFDNLQVDYKAANKEIAEMIYNQVSGELERLGLIFSSEFQSLQSPREYNFRNDSINVKFEFSDENVLKIADYIVANLPEWDKYLKDRFTSYDGFASFYDNFATSPQWTNTNEVLEDETKCGHILNFILENEGYTEDEAFDRIVGNFSISNYIAVIEPVAK